MKRLWSWLTARVEVRYFYGFLYLCDVPVLPVVCLLGIRLVRGIHDDLMAEIERLKAEVELWKDRCAAERQAHEATIENCEDMLSGRDT